MRPRILHLVPSFNMGGSEQQALQLVRMLVRDGGFEVDLACLDKSGVLLEQTVDLGFTEIPEFPLNNFYDRNMAVQTRRFAALLRERNVDVIQTHDFYTNIFGMLASRIARVPVRVTAKRETGMRSQLQKFVERRSFGAATRIIVNSERVLDELTAAGVPKKKLEVVYNGIELSDFDRDPVDRSATLREFGLPEDPRTQIITLTANFREAVKNQAMFIEAARIVSRTNENAAFVMAGEGQLLDAVRDHAARIGIGDLTYFLGRCTNVPRLLSVSDICVLTSDSEGFSNSILEYMAARKPVVATNVGGAAEAIINGRTGFLVEPGDHEALADRLLELLHDRQRSIHLGEEGRKRVEDHFSAETRLRKTIDIYRRELKTAGMEGVAWA